MNRACLLPAAIALVLLTSAVASAAMDGTAYVGTVNGSFAYEVLDGGNGLYFHPQPDTDYVWNQNNGSPVGTVATYTGNGVTDAIRDGMKTFACTDVAYGATLNTIKLQFSYLTANDPNTGLAMSSPSINLFITDGEGHYGIWSPTSKTPLYSVTDLGGGWKQLTLDCTTVPDSAEVAIYEHNGFVNEQSEPYTPVAWGEVKDFTVAGFYDYQRTPEGGFEAWDTTLWSNITNVDVPGGDTTLNEYGITINWGDTVGGMWGDGSGEIGSSAERDYSQAGRMIKDYSVIVDADEYEISFQAGAGPVPEPATFLIWSMLGLLGLSFYARRK